MFIEKSCKKVSFLSFCVMKGTKRTRKSCKREKMKTHRFVLEKYHGPKSRTMCPHCKRYKCFTRYVDLEGKYTFPTEVGRCNHENSCGYHLTPKAFFEQNPEEMKLACFDGETDKNVVSIVRRFNQAHHMDDIVQKNPSYVAEDIMLRSKRGYNNNHFVRFLYSLFPEPIVLNILKRYHIGTANMWDGAVVFWQVDVEGKVHDGKIMLYDVATGHRADKVSWAHSAMKMKDYVLEQCFFGEHLLADNRKPIAIVESEKTAIIASVFMDDFIWLASGGKDGCFNRRKHVLRGRKVVLFPDLKATAAWQKKADAMNDDGIQTEVSIFLEDHASDEEREQGLDIADYIIRLIQEEKRSGHHELTFDEMKALLHGMQERNPAVTNLINAFNLVLVDPQQK